VNASQFAARASKSVKALIICMLYDVGYVVFWCCGQIAASPLITFGFEKDD
jgi:hypothetical protein